MISCEPPPPWIRPWAQRAQVLIQRYYCSHQSSCQFSSWSVQAFRHIALVSQTDDRRLYDGISCLQSTLHGQKMGDSKRVNVPNFSRGAERIIMSFYLDDAFYTNHNVLTVLTHHTCSIQLLRDISNNSLLLVTIVVRRQANIVQTFVFFIKFDQQQNFVIWPLHCKQINWPITAWLSSRFPARK